MPTQLDSQLGQKIAMVKHSEMGDPYQAYNWVEVCNLAIKWHLYIWSHKCACAWMKLVPFIPLRLHFLSTPLSLRTFRKWVRLLATSPDYLWERINACKELCDSWTEGAIGTEIIIKLLNSAVGFTQSAANDCVLCFQAEHHTDPSNQRDRHDPYLCPQGCLAKEQPVYFIKLRRLLKETEDSLVVLWGNESTESHLPWPITTILSGTEHCCFIQHRGLNLVLTLIHNGRTQWGHFIL